MSLMDNMKPLVFLLVVATFCPALAGISRSSANTNNAKGPPLNDPIKSSQDLISNTSYSEFLQDSPQNSKKSDTDFKFTQPYYNASVPENSLASTLVIPSTPNTNSVFSPNQISKPKSNSNHNSNKMGIWNKNFGLREIHYSITSGDPHQMFRVESRQVGDFCFLILRVRNNERILNREFKEVYKIHVKAEVFGKEEKFDNASFAKAIPLQGHSLSEGDGNRIELLEETQFSIDTKLGSFGNLRNPKHFEESETENPDQEHTESLPSLTSLESLDENEVPVKLTEGKRFIIDDLSVLSNPEAKNGEKVPMGSSSAVDPFSLSDSTSASRRRTRDRDGKKSSGRGKVLKRRNNDPDNEYGSNSGESSNIKAVRNGKSGRNGKKDRNKKNSLLSEETSVSQSQTLRRTLREEKQRGSGNNNNNFNNGNSSGNRTRVRNRGGERKRNRDRMNKERGSQDFNNFSNKSGVNVNINMVNIHKDKEEKVLRFDDANSGVKSVTTRTTSVSPTTTTRKPGVKNVENRIPILHTETIVFVRIIDVDDNQPVFESPTYDIGVNEDAPVLSKVAKINAADADVGKNSEIYYSLAEWNEFWSIDPITGVLSPTRPLVGRSKDRDRETIKVRVSNRWNTSPNSGSTANVNIHIRPVNRYAPQIRINRPPQVEVRPYGVIYAVVSIRDADEGENGVVDLEIKEGDPNGIFRVNPTSSRNEFYIEMSPIVAENFHKNSADKFFLFNLTLLARDRGVPVKSSEKELQVRVADALSLWSDKSSTAIFDKDVYEVEISETSPPHSVVFRLKRPDSKVGLSISSGNEGEDFHLEEKSGVLYTSKWLDSETKSTYTLTIDSHDRRPSNRIGDFYRRRQSVAKIIVKVVDGNDNSPEFEPLPNNRTMFTVMENEAVGTKVARIVAKDRDSGENGYVTYSIANLKPTPFTIDHFTGEIRTGRLLDYEIDRREFSLQIRASDWGQPSRRQSQKTITILLKDVNDNRPLFTVKECIAVIDRNIKFETEIGKLEAIDFDREDLVTYRIVGGNEDGCFSLDSMTGKLKVMCDLRDVRVPKRFINVTATDGEYYSDVMSLKVELGDGRINTLKANRSESGSVVRSGIKLFSTSSSVFECEDTGVQERFDRMAALSEKSNQGEDMDLGEKDFPPLPYRYGENVHTPQFVEVPKEILVFENTTVGTTVLKLRAKDLDKGYNGLLTFVISGGDEAHGAWNLVNSNSNLGNMITLGDGSVFGSEASLVVAAPLDREEIGYYSLNISVYDQGKIPKHTSKLLNIKIRDSNDCPPIFSKSAMKIKIGEGSELVGEQILQVSAYDEDEEGSPNSLISYRLLNPSPEFSIDDKSGTIRLIRDLDRERQDLYELLVVAEDAGSPRLGTIALVSIHIEDKNDCSPVFEPFGPVTPNANPAAAASRVVKVMEDWPVGGVVTQVVARDDDLGLSGKVRYALVDSGEEDFTIDEVSGVLRVKKELDYETTSIYNLTISARDLGSPSLSSETFVLISVFDVIESSPTLSFVDIVGQATVSESAPVGTLITQVDLIPPDASETISVLSLEGNSRYLFSIDNFGAIRTTHQLDFETHPCHWLTIHAKNSISGKPHAKMDMFINVTDTNECVPLTTEPSYRVTLPENTVPGVIFLKISAFDCDPGRGLIYSLKTSTPYFEIDPMTGDIETTELTLDREKQPVHIFDVMVTDSGVPPLNSTSQVVVILLDENDNAPKFLHKRGIHNIPEFNLELQGDQPSKKKVKVETSDQDGDIESEESEEVEEDEEDEDAHKWSDWNVIVEQERDNEMFSEGGGWKKIFQVVADDVDEGSNGTVRYRLKYRVSTHPTTNVQQESPVQNGNSEDEVYSINPITGEIFTSAAFIKSDTMLKFMIEATDAGHPETQSSETMLILRVKSVNKRQSQPPQILLTGDQVVQLTTKEQAGYTVETIDAVDSDGDELWYEIVSGDPEQYFIMWPESQNLILARRIPRPMDFKLNISVSDGTNPVFVQLHVKVIESEGFSSLIWSKSNYTAVVPELSTDFGLVTTLKINSTLSLLSSTNWTSTKATESSKTILYGFHNAQDVRSLSIFSIDTLSGEVSLQRAGLIDRETLPKHVITVKARDPSNFYGFVRLEVEVEEFNDHPPVFYAADGRYPRLEVRIPETTAVGALIAQIEAFDMDEGESGVLSYSITFGNIGNTFGIESDSGWLRLSRPLALPFGETQMEYQLTVTAVDGGTPPLSSTTNVNIVVTLASDDDQLTLRCSGDDEPTFFQSSQQRKHTKSGGASGNSGNTQRSSESQRKTVMRVRVKENAQAGSYVTTIKAMNSNSGSVSFEIEENRNNLFWVDPATGVILVGKGKRLLDREQKPSHEILVKATNSRGATANCRVVVDLLDENDHRPVFTSTYYEGLIREDALPGTLVRKKPASGSDSSESEKRPLVLESSDLDVGLNALVTYSIIEEEEMRKVFHIDPSTGALLLVTCLKRHTYIFHVKATDGGGLISPNVATVNVTVENVNMKKPIVQNARVELFLPTAVGVAVYKVEARDPDGDELEYNITRGNAGGFFKIGKKSGEIRIGKIDGFSGANHVIDVSVSDSKFWSMATITIHTKMVDRNPEFYFRNLTFITIALENSTKVINLLSLSVVGAFMNEPLRFEMLTPTKYFGVRGTSGVVYTTGEKLDREEVAEHNLLVQVRGEESSRVARCFVRVRVGVKAFDGDEGENAIIRYELVRSPNGDIYELDRQSGLVRLRRKPDGVGHHEITIKAYDGGVPTCTTETTVLVKIVSSDQPVFEQQFYETWIAEDAALQSTAVVTGAHAKNPILYSIEAGNDFDEFAIDYQTDMGLNRICVLFVNSPLDFETQTTHRLTIRATDLVTSSGSTTQVLIHIRDSNDARPVFEKPIYTIRLVEGYMPSRGLLAVVKAHDNDTGINALLTYELIPDDGPILRLPEDNPNVRTSSASNRQLSRDRTRREISTEDIDLNVNMDLMMVAEDATSNQRAGDVSRFFMVKPNDGSIVLKQMVDYERAHEFRFSIVVKDSGIPALSSTARVVVQVVDINDSGLIFEKSMYFARVSELAPRGHFIVKVSAYDPDSVDTIRYAIVGHNHYQSAFDMDEKSGVVTLSQPSLLLSELNFELNVSVTDGVFTSFSRLHIEVEPRNHHAPAFSSLIYEVGCPENAPDGYLIATLTAVDPDRSIYGEVKYSIAQSDEPDLFVIDESSGEVRLSSSPDVSLDREVKGSHTLEIKVEDRGGWLGYTKVKVKVIDTNEYPPQFPVSEYRITVPADRIRSKTPILQIIAVDADTEFGIRYSIVDLPTSALNLNRSLSGTATKSTLSSGLKRDSSYFEINGDSGEVRLRMSDQDVIKFIKDKSRVDFQFWAGATDEGGLHSYIPVTVVLLPEGVRNPEIQPQNATFFVKEDAPIGSIITTFRVTNIDSPKFRVVSNNDEFFQVDHNGNLLVKARLDQEDEDKHTVVIWAESSDGMSVATSQVTIRVFQSTGRKRPPVFQSQEYKIKVAEDFPEGSLLFTVRAMDSDKSNNIKEKYSLVPSSLSNSQDLMHFSVNQEHGWITLVNKLDYEMKTEHVLHVVAADVDKPYLMSTATVTIQVLNVPDCPVSFDTGHYFSSVREDVPEGTVIATVHATDLDSAVGNGKNFGEPSSIVSNYLAYFILDGNDGGHFKINDRGELSIWRGLDYEEDQKFLLRIVATDGFYSDFANVTVTLIDVNDNSPVCPFPEYEMELSESVPVGTYVVTVEAHDPDLNALAPHFSLSGEGASDFEIHLENGGITTKKKLDRESKANYNLVAYAEDRESGEACRVKVRVKVSDENDNQPRFTEELYTVTVKEDAPVGALIGKVHADDADSGVNRRVRYSLVSVVSSNSGLSVIDDQFSIESSSGVISLMRPLDRELVPGYNLTIQGLDGGVPTQSSVVDMRVIVVDVNDNPPEFAFNYYSATISELAPVSTEVTRVLATSKDIGVNADITYDIVGGNGYNHFGIHPKTGVIFVSAGLDYERIREYVLAIRARDGGIPPLASQALVNISLIDQNDNAPQFSSGSSSYSVQIPEDAAIATSVIQIQAADLDSGANSKITYQLGSGDRMKHFKIDSANGIVSVASALDREMISHYSLEVLCFDHGVPPLSSSTTVQIDILDYNDNPPLIRVPQDEIIVQEDRAVGYTIHRFEVSDADASPNSEPFSWDLRDAEKTRGAPIPFTITEAGTLNVAGKLNSQRKNLYRLQVRVFDNGDLPLYSDANITVKVVDKSQWPPVVSTLTVTAITADETYPAGIPLGKVHASDFDPYDILIYSLVDTPSSTHFTIDSANGTLKSLTPLKAGTYDLGVTVNDGRWTARGDAYIKIVTLASLIPDMKIDQEQTHFPVEKDEKTRSNNWGNSNLKKSRKDISSFAVVMTLKGHNPQSLLTRIFALISSVKEAMGLEATGGSNYDVIVLSVQSAKEPISSSSSTTSRRVKREDQILENQPQNQTEGSESDTIHTDNNVQRDQNQNSQSHVPSVDVLLSVRKSSDGSFVNPAELVKKLRFALPQIESVLSAKVTRITFDVCREDSCERGQCRTVATFEGTQSLITTETLSLITPNHYLETVCFCPPGFGGARCEKVINACAHSECLAGYVCVPDASPKGYACLCRKIYCPPGMPCEEDDHCAQQSVSFSGRSFLAYNVGPSLERELSISLRIKTLYTSGTILHSFGHFDYALLEIRQGLVQFSWDLGTGKEVLTVTSISVADNRWHRILLHLRDNHAVLRVDERSTQRQRSPGAARSLHTGGIVYIGAKIIGPHGSTLESLIPAQGFIGCMKDLRYGYVLADKTAGTDLHIQEVKHYITPGINRIDVDIDKSFDSIDDEEIEEYDQSERENKQNKNAPGGRMAPLPLHSSDSDKLGSHLLWSRNISFSCERILHVVESCRSQPCLNGGSCSEDRLGLPSTSTSGYRCECPSRFHGLNCEIDLDPCGSQPCLNGGTCIPTAPAGTSGVSFSPSLVSGGEWQEPQFFCQCLEGTYGSRCERGRWCKNSEGVGLHGVVDLDNGNADGEVCKHHGECEDGPSGPICWCTGGYTGATCQLDINECERGDACGPASTCINFAGGFRCLCPANATGLRCNRVLATPSIVVSDYQDLIIIVVVIVILFVIIFIGFVLIRRCCINRERNSSQMSNSIPLTSAHRLKDGHNSHSKDNRDRDTSNREQQQLLRNRDSKISNLEVRPVSATSDIFSTGTDLDEKEKPTFINNLMKGTAHVPMRDKAIGCSTGWDPNRDDYSKVQNYMKGDLNWAPRPSSKPGSPTSDGSFGYHWDHSDLTQPANISPMHTLPPPPSDIPDSISLITANNLDGNTVPTINLAALPPPSIDINMVTSLGTLMEEGTNCDDLDDVNPHEPLPYFDDNEGTSIDQPCDDLPLRSNWPILHPDQYLLPHTDTVINNDTTTPEQQQVCSCPHLEVEKPAPIVLRNRYRKTKSSPKEVTSEDEINENSSLLGTLTSNSSLSQPQVISSSNSNTNKSKIPRRQNHQGSSSSIISNASIGSQGRNKSHNNSGTKTTHVTQV